MLHTCPVKINCYNHSPKISLSVKQGLWDTGISSLTRVASSFRFDAAALYDNRTSKVANESAASSESIKQQSILIPVNVRYGVGLGDAANIFLFAGPQWAINVGDSEFKWNSTDSYSLKKSTFSINVGIGATVLSHIQLTANYNIACGKSANLDVWDAVSNATKSYNSRNNTWQIGAAYLF